MPPAWILDIFAALMLAVAAVSVARLGAAQPWQRGAIVTDTDISHLLMGLAMAGMLASSLTTLPDTVWEVVFGVLTAWFAYRVVRDARANGARALAGGHCAPHLVHSGAMLYMFLALSASAVTGGSGMGTMGGGSSGSAMPTLSYPTLAFVFALILIGYTIWDLDQLSALRPGFAAAIAVAASPTLVAAGAVAGGRPAADSSSRPAEIGHVTDGDGPRCDGPRIPGILGSPGIVVGSRIAMGVTMALMLFIVI
jgi:Domain of unknown function (DUF5134)